MTRSALPVRRTLAALAVSPLLVGGLVACGGDDGDPETESGTDAAPAAALSDLGEGDEVETGEFIDIVVGGVEASTTANITMTMSLGEQGEMSGEGALDYSSETPEMAMTMDMDMMGQTMAYDVRLVDGLMYMSMGELTGGKFWKIDPAEKDGPLAELGLDQMLDQVDPLGAMEKMEPAIEKVTYVGEEDVDGRDLDHYELTMDVAAAAGTMGDLPPGAEDQLPDSLTYDIWLDEEDRFAQLSMEFPVMGTTTSMEMTADDWGTDVDIEAPPADEVTEMPDLGGLLGGAGETPAA